MSLTIQEARDEMLTVFKNAVDATSSGDPDISAYLIDYPDQAFEKPATVDSWLRITIQHAAAGESTLNDNAGQKRYFREGILSVQIFIPLGGGATLSDQVIAIIMAAFEGVRTAGGVWFKDVRLIEVGASGDWYQVNVLTNFNYDEVK